MKYSDEQRIAKIADYCAKLLAFMEEKQISRNALMADYTLQWAVTTPLYNIGGHVYYLSDEFKARYPHIPWSMIAGLRHCLVHNYEGTNWSIINEVIFEELPLFAREIEALTKNS